MVPSDGVFVPDPSDSVTSKCSDVICFLEMCVHIFRRLGPAPETHESGVYHSIFLVHGGTPPSPEDGIALAGSSITQSSDINPGRTNFKGQHQCIHGNGFLFPIKKTSPKYQISPLVYLKLEFDAHISCKVADPLRVTQDWKYGSVC